MIYLQIAETVVSPPDLSPIEQAAQAALQRSAAPPADVTIRLSTDEELHQLNRDFLGIDAATDVLAFPLGETDPQSGALYLGDVILSWPRAQAQAAAAGHSSLAELQLLAVHGILHLLGYDHITDDEKARMWQLQRDILADLGLAEIAPR